MMDLLGDDIRWVALAIAVVGVAGGTAVVTLTPRRWWAWITNAVAVLLSSAMLLAAAFLVVNQQNGWYSHISDLWTTPESTITTGGASASVTPRPRATAALRESPPLPQPGQRQQQFSVATSVGSREWPVTVMLPEGYEDPANAQRTYPVLMLGSGFPGTPAQWLNALSITELSRDLVSQGELQPFVAVIPQLWPDGVDTECIFGPDAPNQSEVWLSRDIPAVLGQRLRIDVSGWAVMGASAGGYCASMLTVRYPQQFVAGAMIAGYLAPEWSKATPPWAPGSATDQQHDVLALVRDGTPPPVALWATVTENEAPQAAALRELASTARAPLHVTIVIDSTGGHNFQTWRAKVPVALAWLASTVSGFATPPA